MQHNKDAFLSWYTFSLTLSIARSCFRLPEDACLKDIHQWRSHRLLHA